MDAINLDAADRWRKDHGKESVGEPPAPRSSDDLSVILELMRIEQRRTRTGLAVVLGVAFPGAGTLFLGVYWAAILYAFGFFTCMFMAFRHVDILRGAWLSWPWVCCALGIWVVSFIHTAYAVWVDD